MAILQLPPNPSRPQDRTNDRVDDAAVSAAAGGAGRPPSQVRVKVRTGRYGELEEHELIHLLDTLDDERSRARFRESIYISVIIYLAIAWFLFYGPHILFHQPYYKDPIAAMKQHDQELTLTMPHNLPAPKPPAHPMPDRKTIQQLEKMPRAAPPAPQPPAPAPEPAPQQQASVTPSVVQPPLPMPAAPKPAPAIDAPLPSAPQPHIAQNSQSAGDAVRSAARSALGGRSGAELGAPGPSGPLQAGATILSDTQGVDFSAYMRRLHNDIQRNWDPLIPEEANPPISKRGVVGIRFTILPDGQIGDMKLETVSGDVALDRAAWNAITSEGQFPPLPRAYHGPMLELRVGFFYNTPLPQ